MKCRSAARPLLLGLLVAALGGPGSARAELWRWIDDEGVARYTPDPDRVPAARRSTLTAVAAGMPPAPRGEPEVAKPPPIFAPPGDPALAQDPWNAPARARAIEGEIVRDTGEIVVEVPTGAPPVPSAPPEAAPPPSAPPEAALPAVATAAPAAGPVTPAAPAAPPPLPADREARRAELVAAIARDEEVLKAHVSTGGAASIIDSPQLREIAERLPALQAELRALEAPGTAP